MLKGDRFSHLRELFMVMLMIFSLSATGQVILKQQIQEVPIQTNNEYLKYQDLRNIGTVQGCPPSTGCMLAKTSYQQKLTKTKSGCQVESFKMTYETNIYIKSPQYENKRLEGLFDMYKNAIRIHELDHYETSIRNLQIAHNEIMKLTADSCQELNKIMQQTIDKHREFNRLENIQVDKDFGHDKSAIAEYPSLSAFNSVVNN